MFENITKGAVYTHDTSLKLWIDITTKKKRIAEAKCYGDKEFPPYNEAKQNAEFIAFCFNLQQKYDIGLLSVAVDQLQKILDYWDSGNFTRDPQMWKNTREVIKNIKQNK